MVQMIYPEKRTVSETWIKGQAADWLCDNDILLMSKLAECKTTNEHTAEWEKIRDSISFEEAVLILEDNGLCTFTFKPTIESLMDQF